MYVRKEEYGGKGNPRGEAVKVFRDIRLEEDIHDRGAAPEQGEQGEVEETEEEKGVAGILASWRGRTGPVPHRGKGTTLRVCSLLRHCCITDDEPAMVSRMTISRRDCG